MNDPILLENLLAGGWRSYTFADFRDGVEICTLYEGDSTLALLRYEAGASVPKHRHQGLEAIFVLEGSQSDERGLYKKGSCILNPSGFEHTVKSEEGCVVLVHWIKPVEFV